jgi:5'-AMP-activated protein kinase catalytic alpha subunit
LSDNRHAAVANNYLSGEMQEAPPSTLALGGAHFGMAAGFGGAAAGPGPAHAPRAGTAGGPSHPSTGGGAPAARVAAERRWRLGVAARGHPSALMAELYRVLQVGRVGGIGGVAQGRGPWACAVSP